MSDSPSELDAYYFYLGIPPKDQPPDFYRLLGLERCESNLNIIEMAADRQMMHLQRHESGDHVDGVTKLLSEVAKARLCLLNPEKKEAYDQQFEPQLESLVESEESLLGGGASLGNVMADPDPLHTPQPARQTAEQDLPARSGEYRVPLIVGASVCGGVLLLLMLAFGFFVVSTGSEEQVTKTEVANVETSEALASPPSPDGGGSDAASGRVEAKSSPNNSAVDKSKNMKSRQSGKKSGPSPTLEQTRSRTNEQARSRTNEPAPSPTPLAEAGGEGRSEAARGSIRRGAKRQGVASPSSSEGAPEGNPIVERVPPIVEKIPGFSSPSELNLKEGSPNLKSASALAFGPDGILFVADAKQAMVFALDTQDKQGDSSGAKFEIEELGKAVADILGTTVKDILINDLAVNPQSGNLYWSVSRGLGPDATPVLLRIDTANRISEVSLKKIRFSKVSIPNPPADAVTSQGRRRQNKRMQSITDLGYVDGRLFVAGLSNEEFASTLTSIPFPFKTIEGGTSVEIFHGAHGRFETRSPVQTFTFYKIGTVNHLLAAYTCTPLVRFKISDLIAGQNSKSKLKGTTIAELGNRNKPLDMFVYQKRGKDYLLIANTGRGVMKVSTDAIGAIEGITNRISGTAGLTYETIGALKGVTQLDRLNDTHAVALIVDAAGAANVTTIALP